MKILCLLFIFIFALSEINAQDIPSIYSNIFKDEKGFYIQMDTAKLYEIKREELSLEQLKGNPQATNNGISFDFQNIGLNGNIYYGLIHYSDSKHPQPVYYNTPAKIIQGKSEIDILNNLRGHYDMVGWEKSGIGTLAYRIATSTGSFIYDGIISFNFDGTKFNIANTITQGPFVNLVTQNSATISFYTNFPLKAKVKVNGKTYKGDEATQHEILINKLDADKEYHYQIDVNGVPQNYSFRTAPEKGSRTAFTFAYASDSRGGNGGGERNVGGANTYIMKKIAALAYHENARFFQFTGDLISGYVTNKERLNLEYSNWKRAVQPFGHYMPIYTTIGNHEIIMKIFRSEDKQQTFMIENFPFDSLSAEKIFADNFTNPTNGPESEDGASYDPDTLKMDFPPYNETVYYYVYDNVAMIVLNSNYWFAPSQKSKPLPSGNLHAYIMENQMKWLENTLSTLEKDPLIDHVFITQHTPAFPNGGHVGDDMWYNGNNDHRAYVSGKPVEKGIIECRDEYLNIIVNKNTKVRAILTGDEHNYCRTTINGGINMYPENWTLPKLNLKRQIYQINNGAAGAPYYSQQQTPWSNMVKGFTTQNALVLIDIEGKKASLRVLNPETFETIDELKIIE